MKDEKITVLEFIDEVWKLEGVKLSLDFHQSVLLDHYPFSDPLPGDNTVNDLMEKRIKPILDNATRPLFTIITS